MQDLPLRRTYRHHGQDGSVRLDDGTVRVTLSGGAKATSGNTAEAGWHV